VDAANNLPADRRQWPRWQSQIDDLVLWTDPSTSLRAVVLDESLTGLAVLVTGDAGFRVGQEVRLTYGQCDVFATVRNIVGREDGSYRLGLEWGPADIKPAAVMTLLAKFRSP
jgi:hypothetical protein